MVERNPQLFQMSAAQASAVLGGRRSSENDYRIPHLCGGETALDDNPGLSLSNGRDGALLVHCHYGCEQSDAFAAVSVALGQPRDGGPARVYGDSVVLSLSRCPACDAPGFDARRPHWAQSYAPYLLMSCTAGCSYDSIHRAAAVLVMKRTGHAWLQRAPYTLADRLPRYRFRRDPASGRKGSWESEGKGRKTAGLAPLLWLEGLGPVVLCEGDKAAAALASCASGFSVYSAGDSSALKNADYSALAGCEVVLWPDNDRSGISAMEQVSRRLSAQGCTLSRVDHSTVPAGGDAADLPPSGVLLLLSGASPVGPGGAGEDGDVRPEVRDLVDTTHVADAWRILARHGRRILMAAPANPAERHEIFVLDESTGVWRGGPEPVEGLHSETTKVFAAEVGVAFATGRIDASASRARLSWAKQTQGARGAAEASKMLPTAEAEMRKAGMSTGATVVPESALDPPGHYLGAANGVVDLDSGRLVRSAQAAALLVTRAATTCFDPEASHPLVDDLASHLPSDERDFVLNSFAYALRGTPDRRVNILAGPPNGGKTTLREAVWCAVGDSLAFALPQTSLLQEKYPQRNQHDAGMTGLLTHRFAVGSEIPGGSTPIDAGRLKTISGGDSMALREPNERHRRNRPASATVFLCLNTHNEGCNDLDRLPLHDSAVRDRVKIVLMPQVPGKRDPGVLKRLRSRSFGEAMLAELVRRCVPLQEPPVPPQSVVDAVAEQYERALGPVGEWVSQHLQVTNRPSDWADPQVMHEHLCIWLEERGEVALEGQRETISEIKKFLNLPAQSTKKLKGEVHRVYKGVKFCP